jgi:anaerobic selenocysteine-containing dehydrogenase
MVDETRKKVMLRCQICTTQCPIEVEIENNRPIKVKAVREICPKGAAIPKWYETSLKKRLLHPLQRVNGEWKEISWDEALDAIAKKLRELAAKYGPETLAFYGGSFSGLYDASYFARRFYIAHGTDNYTSGATFCFTPTLLAHAVTFGQIARFDLAGAKCVVSWGRNSIESHPPVGRMVLKLAKQGVKSIVVDPRRTAMAAEANLHIQLRPGTDSALALGLINVIISEGLHDREFVEKWTIGFDKLVEHVRDYDLQKVAEITWVPAEKIREFARIYATSKPGAIITGNAFYNSDVGFQALRAISVLMAITGNVDVPGASLLMPTTMLFPAMARDEFPEDELPRAKAIGGPDEYPLFWKYLKEGIFSRIVDAAISGKPYPIKAMIIQWGNPATLGGDKNKLRRALQLLELVVVQDIFWTETCEFADIVLPAATFLEKQELYVSLGGAIRCMTPVVEPLEDCWSDTKFWIELARRMGYERYFPWKDIDEAQNHILKVANIGVAVDYLKEHLDGYQATETKWQKFEEVGFATPSGKIEIYSETLEKMGDYPLPTYRESGETPVSAPELVKNYPLILITGTRQLPYYHTMFHDVPSLRAACPEPKIEINTGTAKKLRVENEDMVIIESPRGAIQMKAKVTDDILPGVVAIPHGWGGLANQSYLTSNDIRDPLNGFPTFKPLLCAVRNPKLSVH